MGCIFIVMKLKDYLQQIGITDAAFGELVGVSQSQISRIKRGRSKPSLSVAVAIEKATKQKVRANDLLSEANDVAEREVAQ